MHYLAYHGYLGCTLLGCTCGSGSVGLCSNTPYAVHREHIALGNSPRRCAGAGRELVRSGGYRTVLDR